MRRLAGGCKHPPGKAAEGLAVAFGVGELRDRAAAQRARPGVRAVPGGDEGGDRQLGGDREQALDRGFGRDQQRRQRRAEPLRAQGEQQVLHERVDRGAADDARAVKLAVGDQHVRDPHADDQVQRHLVQAVRELVGAPQHPHVGGVVPAGVGEDLARAAVVEVGAPVRLVEVAQGTAGLGVGDRDHAPALAVAAARGEARRLEHPLQHVVLDRVGPEAPRRGRPAHRLVELHGPTIARRRPGPRARGPVAAVVRRGRPSFPLRVRRRSASARPAPPSSPRGAGSSPPADRHASVQ